MYAGLNSPVVVINRRAAWSGNIGQHALILRNKPQILFADSLHPVAAVVSVEYAAANSDEANAYVDLKRRRVSLCRSLNGSSTVAARASGDS